MNALEMLLGSDRVEKRQEKKVKIRRLSPKGKEPVVFTLQSIGWGRVAEIRKLGGRAGTAPHPAGGGGRPGL